MTCIIATIYEGKVHMIGDCMGSNGFIKNIFTKTPKVFSVGDFIIGYTTSFRMGQILQYSWTPPTRLVNDLDDDKYLYKEVIDSIKKCFENNGFGNKEKQEFEAGNFLIGWHGRLFEMQPNMSLMEVEDFASVGGGSYHAVAALKTLKHLNVLQDEPLKALEVALGVAADSVEGVSHEYVYIYEEEAQ